MRSKVRGYSEHTVKNRLVHIGFFIQWAYEHGLREPIEITRPVLERYQRHLFYYRKKNGEPLTFRSQHLAPWVPLRVVVQMDDPAESHPAQPGIRNRLAARGPHVAQEHPFRTRDRKQVMMQPNLADPLGLRDRAILEAIYASGLRRLEVVNLKLFDLQLGPWADRGAPGQGQRKTATCRLENARRHHGFRSTSRRSTAPACPSNRTTSQCF